MVATATPPGASADDLTNAESSAGSEIERELFAAPPGPVPARVVVAVALLAIVLVGLAAQAAAIVESFKPEVWQGTSVVEYRNQDLFTETVAVTLESPTVWLPVAQKYDITVKDFEEHYSANVVDGTQAISVEFLDEDPEVARGVVRDVVTNYLALFETPDDTEQLSVLDEYLETLRVLESDLVATLDERDLLTRTEQIDRQNELISVRQQITGVLVRLDEQGSATRDLEDLMPRVIAEPFLSDEPVEPVPLKMAVFGGAAGGVMAAAMAFVIFFRRAEPDGNT